jgi:hypothetical protein
MARAWIETHYKPTENRTEWRVVIDGAVIRTGDVDDEDVSGVRAHEEAQRWATQNGVTLESWKHAVAHGIYGDLHARTKTDRSTPVRLYGWAICTDGEGREGVGVTPEEMHELVAGALPCPVCGERCGATIEPTMDVATFAVVWNGTRWH